MTSVSWSSTPQSPLGDNSVRPVGSDPIVALGRQVRSIIENLALIPATRRVRAEEALHVLQNTLFYHSEKICDSEQVQLDILRALEVVFNTSVERGCKAFHVIFDFKWKDQHEKRSRCLDLLLRQAMKTINGEMCDQIIKCIVEVLDDNIRTTSDVLEDSFIFLMNTRNESADVLLHIAVYKVLSAFVTTTFGIIRRNPALVESLNKSLPIVLLTKHIIYGSHLSLINTAASINNLSDTSVNSGRSSSVSASSSVDANNRTITVTTSFDTSHGKLTSMERNLLRNSEIALINVMLNCNCYELSLESIMQVVSLIRTAMDDVCTEDEIVGLLQIHSKTTRTVEFQENQEAAHGVTTTTTPTRVFEPSMSSFSMSEALEPHLNRMYSDSQISIPPEETTNNSNSNDKTLKIEQQQQQPLLSRELLPKEKNEEREQFKEHLNQQELSEEELHENSQKCEEEALLIKELRTRMLEFVLHEENIDVVICGVKCIVELLGTNGIIVVDDVPAIVRVLQSVLVKHEFISVIFDALSLIQVKFGNDALAPL